MPQPGWSKSLENILGADHVISDDATLDANSAQAVKPACLCAPENAEQIAAVIRFAAENKIAVLPRGGGTGQGIGSPPPPDALVLSTRRLNALVHHEPGDMVATVQSGMTLGDFQNALAQNGQWLPLDGDSHSTIGGLIATDRSGPRALGYGTLRDMVLGMSVVNGDGISRKCGGKVVKNVTGYDLNKLYIGSLGTLGVVTEVTFKLRPLPIGRRQWIIKFSDLKSGIDALKKLGAMNLPFEALQLYDANAVFILGISPKHDPSNPACSLLLSAAGTDVELTRIEQDLKSAIPAHVECKDNIFDAFEIEGEPMMSLGVRDNDPEKSFVGVLRFWCVPSKLEAAVAALKFDGSSGLSLGLTGGAHRVTNYELKTKIAKVCQDLSTLGINFRFENNWFDQVAEPFGPPRPEWALMKQIHKALDPQGILNPGRFVV